MLELSHICRDILKTNPKIRYVGIFYQDRYNSELRQGVKSLLNEGEIKKSAINALKRWETRLVLTKNLGYPIYSLTKYEKVNRITFPIAEDGLILVSTEKDLDPSLISDKILKIRKKVFDV